MFCLLDLSAAFNSTNSWFGIHGSVLNWLTSYLLPSCFRTKYENSPPFLYTSSCGAPYGSALGPRSREVLRLKVAMS